MTAKHAAIFEHQPDELPGGSRYDFLQCIPANETPFAGFHSHSPCEARFERMSSLVHIVAVEIHASFEAECVACTQTARCNISGVQLAPHTRGICRWQHDLETILAGITGACDKPVTDVTTEEWTQRQCLLRVRGRHERSGFGARLGTLNSEHRVVSSLCYLHGKSTGGRANPRQVLIPSSRVDHHPEGRLVQKVDDEIVQNSAGLIQHARVQCLARELQLADVIGEQMLKKFAHARALEVNHTHVGDIEDTRFAAHSVMLIDLGGVLDGHVPATEIHY